MPDSIGIQELNAATNNNTNVSQSVLSSLVSSGAISQNTANQMANNTGNANNNTSGASKTSAAQYSTGAAAPAGTTPVSTTPTSISPTAATTTTASPGTPAAATTEGVSGTHITDYMSSLGGSAAYNSSTGMTTITAPNGMSVSINPNNTQIPGLTNINGYLYITNTTEFNGYLMQATGYSGTTAAASQNNLTNQIAKILDVLTPTTTTPIAAPATTTAPTASQYQPTSWADALAQAQQVTNPATTAATQQLTDTYNQNLQELPYTLSGRGELQSGLLGGGTSGLTQAQASALSQLSSTEASNTASLANQIQEGSQNLSESQYQDALDSWSTSYNQTMDLYNSQVSQKQAATQQTLSSLLSALGLLNTGETTASSNASTTVQNLLSLLGTPAAATP